MADTLRDKFANRRSPLADIAGNRADGVMQTPQPAAIMLLDGTAEAPPEIDAATLRIAPRQWLVVSEQQAPATLAARLADAAGGCAVTDESHARFRIRLHGSRARQALASGIDVDPATWPQHGTATAFREIAVVLHAAGAQTYDLYVFRSYAASLWTWLADAVDAAAQG